jgi:hypothetical protein
MHQDAERQGAMMDTRLLGNNVDVVGLEKEQDEEQESPRKSQRQRPKRHFDEIDRYSKCGRVLSEWEGFLELVHLHVLLFQVVFSPVLSWK